MTNRKITVHIGLHKTGTIFLQKHIFPKIDSLTIIRAWDTHRKITDSTIKENILITDEGISGDPWRGNYFNDFKKNIKNIKHLYGDVKIIFGYVNMKILFYRYTNNIYIKEDLKALNICIIKKIQEF